MPSIHCCNIHRTNQYRNEIRLLNLYAVNLVLLYHDMFNLLKHLCMHTSSPNLISHLWLAISTSTTPPKSKTEPPKRKKGKIISDLVGMPALSQLNRSFLNISKNSKWFKGFGFQHSLAFTVVSLGSICFTLMLELRVVVVFGVKHHSKSDLRYKWII